VTASDKATRLKNIALIVQDTEEEVIQAAGSSDRNLLKLVLDRRGYSVPATEETLVQLARLHRKEVIILLLN
jgi:hypothetical protein